MYGLDPYDCRSLYATNIAYQPSKRGGGGVKGAKSLEPRSRKSVKVYTDLR